MRARSLLVPLAVLALLLTGCTSDDPEPTPSPSASAPSPSDDPTTPSPSESETASAEGPKAFIRRWVKVKDQMIATGRTEAFKSLSARACTYCDGLVREVSSTYDSGARFETDGWTLDSLEPASGSVGRETFRASVRIAEAVMLSEDGEVLREYPAVEAVFQFEVKERGGVWALFDLAEVAQ